LLLLIWIIGFLVLFLFDYYNLKREGVLYEDESFPFWRTLMIFFIFYVGVPAVLIVRYGILRDYRRKGGPALSRRHAFFNWTYGIMLVLLIPLLTCCWWEASMYPEMYQLPYC
jgi:magnesium-transporting ATPase (P-type)